MSLNKNEKVGLGCLALVALGLIVMVVLMIAFKGDPVIINGR